jgi:hypothetical protein
MTFADFQSMCNGVAATSTAASAPCPIYVGDQAAKTSAWYGQGLKELVIFKEQVPQDAMLAILNSCAFTYDEPNNLTVVSKKNG